MCKGIPLKSPYHQCWFIYNCRIRSYMWYVCVYLRNMTVSQKFMAYDHHHHNHRNHHNDNNRNNTNNNHHHHHHHPHHPHHFSWASDFINSQIHKFFIRCVAYQVREDKSVPLRFESYLSALMGFGHIFLAPSIGCKSLAGKSTAGWNFSKLPKGKKKYIYSYMSHMIYLCLFSIRASILQLLLHRNTQASFAICFCKLTQVLGRGFKYICCSHPYLGKIPMLANILQRGWNQQLVLQKGTVIEFRCFYLFLFIFLGGRATPGGAPNLEGGAMHLSHFGNSIALVMLGSIESVVKEVISIKTHCHSARCISCLRKKCVPSSNMSHEWYWKPQIVTIEICEGILEPTWWSRMFFVPIGGGSGSVLLPCPAYNFKISPCWWTSMTYYDNPHKIYRKMFIFINHMNIDRNYIFIFTYT